ncbi:MAG: hypothetical protein ABIL89_00060 [candidate division WOR-3 bacterium]
MRRFYFLIIFFVLSCSKKTDTTSPNPISPDAQYVIEKSPEFSIMSIQSIIKPNIGGLMRTTFRDGFFVYQYDSVISLKPCRDFADYPGVGYDTLDLDGDGVYNYTGIIFNCNGIDTISLDNILYEVNYSFIGYSFHRDSSDNDPYSFKLWFGDVGPFKMSVKSKNINTGDTLFNYVELKAFINSIKTSSTTLTSYINREVYKTNPTNSCEPVTITNDTININFSNAPSWKPLKSFNQGEYILAYLSSIGNVITCNNDTLNIRISTIDSLKISLCSNKQDGPISGKLKLEILNNGITKYITYNDCKYSVGDN